MAVEDPGDSPVISASFGAHVLPVNATDFLPFFGTDFGFCSLIKPQLNFNANYSSFPFSTKLFGPKREPESYSRQIKPGRYWLKLTYSEKATKFCEIFTLLLTGTT